MRPEQKAAVKKTQEYFHRFREDNPGKAPRFLWNAKMRFGPPKTFTSYEFAKAEGYKRVLILTFKPAVADSWREDLESHKDFEGWQYISRDTELTYETADKSRPIVCFGSFQDYLARTRPEESRPATNGFTRSTGIWSYSTNTISALGETALGNCSSLRIVRTQR